MFADEMLKRVRTLDREELTRHAHVSLNNRHK